MVCATPGCRKYATKNFPSVGAKPRYCTIHAPPGTVNLKKGKPCACGRVASFGLKWGERPSSCAKCKTEGMFCVKGYKCELCDKNALYNLAKESKPRFCRSHKTPLMFDVKRRRCVVEGCRTQPIYRLPESAGLPTHCGKHKTSLMQNISKPRCVVEGCDKTRFYGPRNGRPLTCSKHGKPFGYIDVKHNPRKRESPESRE